MTLVTKKETPRTLEIRLESEVETAVEPLAALTRQRDARLLAPVHRNVIATSSRRWPYGVRSSAWRFGTRRGCFWEFIELRGGTVTSELRQQLQRHQSDVIDGYRLYHTVTGVQRDQLVLRRDQVADDGRLRGRRQDRSRPPTTTATPTPASRARMRLQAVWRWSSVGAAAPATSTARPRVSSPATTTATVCSTSGSANRPTFLSGSVNRTCGAGVTYWIWSAT